MQVTYAPDEPQLFWLREKPEDPQYEPHAEIKMAQVLGSPVYIYAMNSINFNSKQRLFKRIIDYLSVYLSSNYQVWYITLKLILCSFN